MLKIVKFGGSSVSSPSQFKKVKDIVLSDESRKVIVVSALGKDMEHSSKVTDLLFLLHAHLEFNIDYNDLFQSIVKRFVEVKNELNLIYDVELELENLKKSLHSKISKDYLVSRGEFYTAKLLSEYLGYPFIDIKDILFLEYDGSINYDKTIEEAKSTLEKLGKFVVPGYYASTPEQDVRLFGRGGSDLTGSILAKSLQADLYENWTDVSGIYAANPNIVESSKRIEKIIYSELRELSYRGANVLHEETILPLEQSNIPIQIKNTNDPSNPGTIISNTVEGNGKYITGIAGKKDFTSFNITKKSDVSKIKVLRDVLDLFLRYNVNIEHIPSGIDSFSVIVETSNTVHCHFELIAEIRAIKEVIDLSVENEIALIAVVGRNMAHIPGISGKVFSTLGRNNINVKIIAQASTELSIIIGVDNKDYKKAIQSIYKKFFSEIRMVYKHAL